MTPRDQSHTISRAAGAAGSRAADRPTSARAGLKSRRRDSGSAYIEIVVTIVLLGMVVAPMLSAVVTSIKASTISSESAELETVLVNAVDRINRAERAKFPCDLTAPATAAVETHGWSPGDVVVRHEYLDTNGNWVTDPSGTACPGGSFQPGIVQRITVTVTSPDNRVSRSLQVVKSDV